MTAAQDQTVYLISGANRGIGFGLVQHLSKRSNAVIYAGARDPAKATELNALAKSAKNVHVIQLTSSNEKDNKAAAQHIQSTSGRLDVVIANAGVGEIGAKAAEMEVDSLRRQLEINTVGPLVLFQAVWSLLQKSHKPLFTVISSVIGSIELQGKVPWPSAGYGTSKAAVNYLLGKIHHEYDNLICFSTHPGWVQTDMGDGAAKIVGMDKAPLSVDDSVAGMLKLFDQAERTTHGHKMWQYDGTVLPW